MSKITTRPATDAYRTGWDNIFNKEKSVEHCRYCGTTDCEDLTCALNALADMKRGAMVLARYMRISEHMTGSYIEDILERVDNLESMLTTGETK